MLRCTTYKECGMMYRVHLVTPCSGGYGEAYGLDGWVFGTYAVDLRTRIVEITTVRHIKE